MKFIVGIGNPEPRYENTRHNAGFRVLDALKDSFGGGSSPMRWQADRSCRAWMCQVLEQTWLVKPSTYVNLTGNCIEALAEKFSSRFFLKNLLFVCDDVHLDFGVMRFRASGSAGGHHGLESVIATLGSEEFARLRIGIRNCSLSGDLASFVLEEFSPKEEGGLPAILDNAVRVSRTWLACGSKEAADHLSRLQSKA